MDLSFEARSTVKLQARDTPGTGKQLSEAQVGHSDERGGGTRVKGCSPWQGNNCMKGIHLCLTSADHVRVEHLCHDLLIM
jgi:hypothetical protein